MYYVSATGKIKEELCVFINDGRSGGYARCVQLKPIWWCSQVKVLQQLAKSPQVF